MFWKILSGDIHFTGRKLWTFDKLKARLTILQDCPSCDEQCKVILIITIFLKNLIDLFNWRFLWRCSPGPSSDLWPNRSHRSSQASPHRPGRSSLPGLCVHTVGQATRHVNKQHDINTIRHVNTQQDVNTQRVMWTHNISCEYMTQPANMRAKWYVNTQHNMLNSTRNVTCQHATRHANTQHDTWTHNTTCKHATWHVNTQREPTSQREQATREHTCEQTTQDIDKQHTCEHATQHVNKQHDVNTQHNMWIHITINNHWHTEGIYLYLSISTVSVIYWWVIVRFWKRGSPWLERPGRRSSGGHWEWGEESQWGGETPPAGLEENNSTSHITEADRQAVF